MGAMVQIPTLLVLTPSHRGIGGICSSGYKTLAGTMNKADLARKIQTLEGLSNEEKTELLELIRGHKKYGLIWEDKPEDIEERLWEDLPVLVERNDDKVHPIISDNLDAPNHLIIEGDNLAALTELSYTHAGKIDVIYIDPPYNTGNKDFIYNDSFVDKEDSFRHSKWLSFISKRLRNAKSLLSERGVIFISIDDNEQANLKILCDEIFGQLNFVGSIPTIMNLKGNQAEYGFAGTHEYTLVYTLNKNLCTLGNLIAPDEEIDTWEEDEIGYYKKGATLKRTGADAPRSNRPYGYFPILVNNQDNSVSTLTEDEYRDIYIPTTKSFNDLYVEELKKKYQGQGFSFILPIVNGQPCSWRWGFKTVKSNLKEIIVIGTAGDFSLYKKQRPEIGDIPSKKPKSVLYKAQYSSGNGTAQLKELSLDKYFNNPKPIDLIIDLLRIGNCKFSTILDFFAGSGTTLHAVMQLNAEDGGKRTCILCTNNENGICENVTYERNKRVIEGYTKPNGEEVAGLTDNNLRYYRTEFLPRERSVKNMRELVQTSTGLLCIKNNLYTEAPFGGRKMNPKYARYFENNGQSMLVIYEEQAIPFIAKIIKTMPEGEKIKVYVFSHGSYAYDDEFAEVADLVTLCALPQAIYDAYQKVLPKRKPKFLVDDLVEEIVETEAAETQATLDFGTDDVEEGGDE